MKYRIKEKYDNNMIYKIKIGELFIADGQPYMKIEEDHCSLYKEGIRAVNLETGKISKFYFCSDTIIKLVKDYNLDITI